MSHNSDFAHLYREILRLYILKVFFSEFWHLTNLFYLLTSRNFYILILNFSRNCNFTSCNSYFFFVYFLLFLVYFFPTEFWDYIFQLIFLYLFFIPWQKLFNFLLTLLVSFFSSSCLAIISYKLAIQTFFLQDCKGKINLNCEKDG